MTIQFWQDMSILVAGLEIAGNAKSVNLSTEVTPLDVTALNTTGWVSLIGGQKSGSVDLTLMQDVATGSVDDTLYPLLGVADTPHSICTASADGSKAYLFRGIPLSYSPINSPVGDVAMGQVSGMSSTGGIVRGKLIHPGSTARTSSTGTGRQLGAVVAGKSLYAALHVLSVSGTSTPTITVKVQSDDNGSFTTPTDRITFTAATAVGAQWGSVAGAITDDYWRISFTISGTNPSFLFAVTAGIL